MTESNKLLMQRRGPYIVDSRVGANEYQEKMESETKTFHMNMLRTYFATEPKVDVVHKSNNDDATITLAGVICQDANPKLGGKYQT